MTVRRSLTSCAAALALAAAVVPAGLTAANAATGDSASRALTVTDFAFQSNSWAARVTMVQNQIRTTRLPYSYLACTRQAGKVNSNSLTELTDDGLADFGIVVKGLSGTNATYKTATGRVGSRAMNRVGDISLAPPLPEGSPFTAPGLVTIKGLTTKADAFHTRSGFGADTAIEWGTFDVQLPEGLLPEDLEGPAKQLFDLLNSTTGSVNQEVVKVVNLLETTLKPIQIPGLATFDVGYERTAVGPNGARAGAYGLLIQLLDGPKLELGRSQAAITGGATSGVIRGRSYSMKVQAAPGAPGLGEVGVRQIPCTGTNGRTKSFQGGALNFEALGLKIGDALSQVSGEQLDRRQLSAWQSNAVEMFALGDRVKITAIKAQASAFMRPDGRVVKSAKGSGIGQLLIDGKPAQLPSQVTDFKLPGGALLSTNVVNKGRRGIRVTAVQIELPSGSFVRVGNAQVYILRK